MSTNHHARIEAVVDKALRQAAMGEPYGFFVSPPSMWPMLGPDRQPTGQIAPSWFVGVTIRATGLGEPDVGNGFPVVGILPSDADFEHVAKALLELCRQERDADDASALLDNAVSGDEVLRRMREGS